MKALYKAAKAILIWIATFCLYAIAVKLYGKEIQFAIPIVIWICCILTMLDD